METKRPLVDTRVRNISLNVNFQFSRSCLSLFSFQRNLQCFKKPHIFKTSLSCSSLFSGTNTHRQSKSNATCTKTPARASHVLVCYTAVFSVVTQRSSPGPLRDDSKTGCLADYPRSRSFGSSRNPPQLGRLPKLGITE